MPYARVCCPRADLLFKVSGSDKLGIVSEFSAVLANHNAVILDVEQAACTVHSTFSLNLLARCSNENGNVVESMVSKAQELQVNMGATVVQNGSGDSNLRPDGESGSRLALTLEGDDLKFSQLAGIGVRSPVPINW